MGGVGGWGVGDWPDWIIGLVEKFKRGNCNNMPGARKKVEMFRNFFIRIFGCKLSAIVCLVFFIQMRRLRSSPLRD